MRQLVFERVVALSASGARQKGRTPKQTMAEDWVLLCHLAVLCVSARFVNRQILPQACICQSGLYPLAKLWESLKEFKKCLNGSGRSRLLLIGYIRSSVW